MKVGFIGLGHMGTAMATSLLQAGHEVAVYNRTPGKAQGLIDQGATQEVQQLATGGLLLLVVAVEFITGMEASDDRWQFPTEIARRFGGLRRRVGET